MIGHMTRGVAEKLALEEVKAEFGNLLPEGKTLQFVDIQREAEKNTSSTPVKSPTKAESDQESLPQQKRLLED